MGLEEHQFSFIAFFQQLINLIYISSFLIPSFFLHLSMFIWLLPSWGKILWSVIWTSLPLSPQIPNHLFCFLLSAGLRLSISFPFNFFTPMCGCTAQLGKKYTLGAIWVTEAQGPQFQWNPLYYWYSLYSFFISSLFSYLQLLFQPLILLLRPFCQSPLSLISLVHHLVIDGEVMVIRQELFQLLPSL